MKYNTYKEVPQDAYKCYSTNLWEYLEENGEECVYKFINVKTGKHCKVYEMNPNLEKLLKEWSSRKNQ